MTGDLGTPRPRQGEAPVAVGYDGSPPSKRALEWAVEEARLRRRPLLIVAVHLTFGAPPYPDTDRPDPCEHRQAVFDMLEAARSRVHRRAPDIDVSCELFSDVTAAAGLVPESHLWALLVLGDRGGGGFAGILLGSTSTQAGAHARCPVIIARGEETESNVNSGRIVIGVDGSSPSRAAARFGLEEARLRGAPVSVVHGWRYPTTTRDGFMSLRAGEREEMRDRETALLVKSLSGIRSEFPDVEVDRLPVHGGAREVLLEKSAGARLLVVGSRGRGGFSGLVLGSTSQAVLHHAKVPVAIVHSGDELER